jgi:uncharacterized protein
VVAIEIEERSTLSQVVADPAPLGLGAFALTTFLLSGHNATFIPDLIWVAPALFYGGLAQLCAGMWEFKNRNVFGATAFSTYGGFWLALGIFVTFIVLSKNFAGAITANPHDVPNAEAWFLVAFAIFNTYMMLWALRVNLAVFGVFRLDAARRVGDLGSAGRPAVVGPAAARLAAGFADAERAGGLGWRR